MTTHGDLLTSRSLPTAAQVLKACGACEAVRIYEGCESGFTEVMARIEEIHVLRGPQFDRRIADLQCENLAEATDLARLQADILDIIRLKYRSKLRGEWWQ